MTRPESKAEELAHVRALLAAMPHLDVSGEPSDNRESPDFILALSDGRQVGLEHVRAVDEGIARGHGTKQKLRRKGLATLAAAGTNAQVVVSIPEGVAAYLAMAEMKPALAAEIDAIAALAKMAIDMEASRNRLDGQLGRLGVESPPVWRHFMHFDPDMVVDGDVCWRDSRRDDGSYDIEGTGVEFCSMVMVRPSDTPHMGCNGTGTGQSRRIIQDAIDAKAKKLASYRSKSGLDAQWLLVVGSSTTGGTLDISDAEGDFTSPFDRTFFLETFEDLCTELSTVRADR